MALISLKCPSCGANIDFDNSRDFGFCSYCGTKIMIEKKIVEHRGSVGIDHSCEIKNLLLRGQEMYSAGRLADAEVYFNRVLDLDAVNKEARDALRCINKIVDSENVVIERLPSKYFFQGVKMHLKLNGEKIGFINEGGRISLKLPVGTHYIEPHFTFYKKNKPISVVVSDRHTRAFVTLVAGMGGSVDVTIK